MHVLYNLIYIYLSKKLSNNFSDEVYRYDI